jgi:hypothetical protein
MRGRRSGFLVSSSQPAAESLAHHGTDDHGTLLSEPPADGTNDFGGKLPDYIQTELEQVFELLPPPG